MEGWTDKRKEGGGIEEEIGELLRLSIRKMKQPSRQSDDSEAIPMQRRTTPMAELDVDVQAVTFANH